MILPGVRRAFFMDEAFLGIGKILGQPLTREFFSSQHIYISAKGNHCILVAFLWSYMPMLIVRREHTVGTKAFDQHH